MRDEFERALDENPDDEATIMAYGDWLAEQGDPRGEFMQLQYALAHHSLGRDDRVKSHLRMLYLLETHGAEWVGQLAGHLGSRWERLLPDNRQRQRCGYAFRNGWLYRLDFDAIPAIARAIVAEPLCKRLVELAVRKGHSRNGTVLPLLAGTTHLANIRRLELGGTQGYIGATGVVPLVASLPRVESLTLQLRDLEAEDAAALFALPLPQLKSLDVKVTGARSIHLPIEPLLGNSTLHQLDTLTLEPTRAGGNLSERVQRMRDLCGAAHLKKLRSLTWHCHGSGDQGMAALAQSELVTRLEILDLSQGDITDQGAETFAAAWRPSWRLKRLTLYNNRLTVRGIDAIQQRGIRLDA